MEQLIKEKANYKVCFLSGLIIGILIGASAIGVIVSHRLDVYYKDVALLQTTIDDKNARLERLENTINTKNMIVKDIEIYLLFDEDAMDKIDMEKSINEKYSTLLGKEVKDIDIDIVIEVIDRRIFKIEDRQYQLFVSKVVLTEVLRMWVDVKPLF